MDGARQARKRAPGRYPPRRPSESVLYRCVQEHLETWLAQCRDGRCGNGRFPCPSACATSCSAMPISRVRRCASSCARWSPACARRGTGSCLPPPARPPTAALAATPTRKCHDQRAQQPLATANRRLTGATDATTIKLARWNCLSFATTTDITTTDVTQCRPVRTGTGIAMSHCDMRTATEAARHPGST